MGYIETTNKIGEYMVAITAVVVLIVGFGGLGLLVWGEVHTDKPKIEAAPSIQFGSPNSGIAELEEGKTYWIENGMKVANMTENHCIRWSDGELGVGFFSDAQGIPCWAIFISSDSIRYLGSEQMVYVPKASSTKEIADVVRARIIHLMNKDKEESESKERANAMMKAINEAMINATSSK